MEGFRIKMQIAVNVIVGTSVGAIVAASYASGLPLPAIDKEMSGLRTAMLFHDVDRSETPLRGKLDDAVNYLGPEIGPQGGSQAFPKGWWRAFRSRRCCGASRGYIGPTRSTACSSTAA